jgi:hypothetical protein
MVKLDGHDPKIYMSDQLSVPSVFNSVAKEKKYHYSVGQTVKLHISVGKQINLLLQRCYILEETI